MTAVGCQEPRWTTFVHPIDPGSYSLQRSIAYRYQQTVYPENRDIEQEDRASTAGLFLDQFSCRCRPCLSHNRHSDDRREEESQRCRIRNVASVLVQGQKGESIAPLKMIEWTGSNAKPA